jgi:hypothetical protein
VTAAAIVRESHEEISEKALERLNTAFGLVGAKLIRDWVRSQLIPSAVMRLFEIGTGQAKFDVPTEAGNVVTVEAFASVQVQALAKLVDIGVPRQLGLIDSTGEDLPGVIALGPLELDELQTIQHAQRFPQLARFAGNGAENGHPSNGDAEVSPAGPSQPAFSETDGVVLSPSVRSGGYEIVEIEQDAMAAPEGQKPGEVPPPPIKREPTLAQQILARRRAARHARPPSADETP